MTKHDSRWRSADIFAWSCAALFLVLAASLWSTTGDEARRVHKVLISREPIFETTQVKFMHATAALHVAAAVFLLFGWNALTKAAVIGWLGSTHVIYYIGLLVTSTIAPPRIAQAVATHMGYAPERIVFLWKLLMAYSIAGAALVMLREWFRARQERATEYSNKWREYRLHGSRPASEQSAVRPGEIKRSCPKCGQHVRVKEECAGMEISCPMCSHLFKVHKEPELSSECYFCKGHIRFPTHATGAKIRCPHCKMDITLKEAQERPIQHEAGLG